MALDDATLAEPSPLDTDEIPVVVVAARQGPVWAHTWALGSAAVVLAVFMAATGIGLLFFYRPLVASAHAGLVELVEASRFGFLRELHRWGSHAFLILVALHLLRIVLTGAYHPPKRFNYHLGVVLALVVLGLAASGYLLPWDYHAQWLIELLSERGLRAGDSLLNLAYGFHCGVLPVGGAYLLIVHVRRARRDAAAGDSIEQSPDDDEH